MCMFLSCTHAAVGKGQIIHTAGWDTIFSHIYLIYVVIEVDIIEILEIMPQMWQYVIF